MTKILILTKEIQLSRSLNYALTFNGFIVECVYSSQMAIKYLQEINFNLILLDFNFKASNGIQFYQELQKLNCDIPVIVMGESYEEVSIVENMYSGMCDYILKPFHLTELKMLVNKQLERIIYKSRPIIFGDLKIDVSRSLVTVKNQLITLGKKELEILILLSRKAGKIVSSDALLTADRIKNLSIKLAAAGKTLQIKNVGVGYKLIHQRH